MLQDLKIILAEDDYDDRSFFTQALSELYSSYKLHVAQDGELLLEMLEKYNGIPDLIVLDVNMPKKDGINCLQEIRSVRRFDQIPIVMLSTSSEDRLVEKAFLAGASYFIKKPDNFPALKDMVRFCTTLPGTIIPKDKNTFLVPGWKAAGC